MKRTVGEIARTVGARTVGDERVVVTGVASLDTAGACDLVFVEEECYLASALDGSAAAVIAGAFAETSRSSKPLLITSHPRLAFARAAACLRDPDERKPGVHPSAVVLPSARVAGTAIVDPWTFVAESAVIGERTWIGSGCVVGSGVVIGDSCRIYPRVTIYPGTRIGDRVIVHAGAVLGSDGFGYVNNRPAADRVGESAPPRTAPAYEKFPQIGKLHIEDDVEIGANTTIDRGALQITRIGRGTKIDNLVHIGHNCKVGENVIIAAQAGFSGSVVIEDNAVIGGQVGVGEHAHIKQGVLLGGQAGILPKKILRGNGVAFWGTPAKPLREYLKSLAALAKLGRREGNG
ncbi:MAG TPA: UDP-3-O-(3-hydroxymyristoyl)glucosamine N-acyltransferase [Terriglobales bacterium]